MYKARFFILILILVVTCGAKVFAATWVATENFDTYTNGSNLNGDSGGSGWGGNWGINSGTDFTTATAPVGGQGCIAAKAVSGAGGYVQRALTAAIDNSTVHVQFWTDDTTSGHEYDIAGVSGGTSRWQARLNQGTGGHVYCSDGTSYNTDTGETFTGSAWHTIDIQFGGGTFKISTDGGAFSGSCATTGGSSQVDTFLLSNASGATSNTYFDDIGPSAGATCGSAAPIVYSDDDIITQMLSLFYAQ